ncbi:MAG: right-handed parallel beta-helix repeat-containing protein, partial [Candidatus Omnitrophica bacterium]|nr:right-handed parallel beta-helix repeat-containing protein [Candidatus Omnitrophota bacterium]
MFYFTRITTLCFALFLAANQIQAATFYVSTSGDDSWSGQLEAPNEGATDGPFRSLERSVAAVKKVQREAGTQVKTVVRIRGGRYERKTPIVLETVGSGNSDAGTVFEAYPGEEVVITGGMTVDSWKKTEEPNILERLPEEARGQVYESDLFAQGITDYGVLKERGFGRPVYPAALELFFDNEPMTLARWPNEGYAQIANVPGPATGGKFNYEGDRPERWMKANDIWLHGLWTWDWADSYTRVKSIDAASKEFTTYPPHGVYGYKKDRRYYALNLLEELDQPGEYYLDRLTGVLYFWPPSGIEKGKAVVSLADELLRLENCSSVQVKGLTFEVTRGNGVEVRGGTNNRIQDCVIRNIGNTGAIVSGGTRNGVVRCEIYNCGDGGTGLSGGDRKSLTPGHNEVTDCHIHHYSRWSKTYRPSVAISGVWNPLAHNLIHDAPHNA